MVEKKFYVQDNITDIEKTLEKDTLDSLIVKDDEKTYSIPRQHLSDILFILNGMIVDFATDCQKEDFDNRRE